MAIKRKRSHANAILFLIIFALPVFSVLPAYSQDCGAQLQEANNLYDQGLIEDIPGLLLPCMEEGFSRSQRIEAYKLLILAYLFDNDQVSAETTMLDFLRKFPEYEILPGDPAEFVYLFESYRTTSVYSIGVSVGFNMTDPRLIEPFSVLDVENTSLQNKMQGGFQLGLGLARYVSNNMILNAELLFSSHQYEFSDFYSTFVDGADIINNVTYTERLYKFDVPVSVTYEILAKKIHYYLRGGVSFSGIIGARGNASRVYARESSPFTSETLSMTEFRKKILYSAVAGAGIMYKVPRGMITLDFRANFGLKNIVREKERYNNPELMTKYNYLDDDFSLNVFTLSANYYFSFYTPSKQR